MKSEWTSEQEYGSHELPRRDITDYIAGFYNDRRTHSAANGLPPVRYETSIFEKPLCESPKRLDHYIVNPHT
ncbi:IS3 family transposase [Paraburkholderia rhynchosiae]|uniref:IS3 family transposase n=1 Tax=Paraburkholderia rhynchosiae TaxID=487049 RepID=UPI00387E9F08